MAPSQPHQFGGNESLSQRPQFFKVLFPNPFAYMRIPHNFRTNLPHGLPKLATLSGPSGTNWCVEIHQNGQDIFFQRGWPEFAKAHDLLTGYFLVFRYDGNMVFNVTIFDTTSCLKEYAQPPVMQSSLNSIEIDDSSESSDETLSVKAHDADMEISSDCLSKRKKLSNGKTQRVLEKKKGSTSKDKVIPRRNNVKISSQQSLCQKSEGERKSMINSIGIKRKANMKAKEEFRKEKKPTLQKKELTKTITIIHDSTDYQQFEKILTDAALKHNEINIAKHFFIKNGLVGKKNIFLKTKLDGKPWEMRIFFKEYHVRICKGWTGFAKENGLKAGDRMIFKLVSKDTFLIKVVSNISESETRSKIRQKHTVDKQQVSKASKREINTTTSSLGMKRKANGKTKVEFRKEKKPTLQQKKGKKPVKIIQNSTDCRQFEKILSPTSVKRNDLTLPKKFFIKNGLVEKQTLFLKSTIDGIPWESHFSSREYDVRLCKGWLGFAKENGLKVGDRLSFKLVSKDTFLINVVSKTSEIESRPKIRQKVVDKLQVSKTSKSDSRSKIRQKRKVGKKQIPFKKSTVEGEISKIVRDYNLRWMYMYFAKSFCMKNKLTLRRDMILKDLKGKEWLVKFSYNGQHGRFSGGWNNFCTENRLKEGDKCIFKLINEGTMLVHIIKSESD